MTARIGITGIEGQLGFHTRAWLQHHCGFQVAGANRQTFASPDGLRAFVRGCDVVVHLAGVNRGDDTEIAEGNRSLASALAKAIEDEDISPHVIYASSIQRHNDSVYGRAKAAAADILSEACARRGAAFTEIVFPNLFGEFTRPNYNSFVGTFCHQIANGASPTIHGDNAVRLMHYLDAAVLITEVIEAKLEGRLEAEERATSVAAVASKLLSFHDAYSKGIIPDLRDRFDLQLFNSYRSAVYPSMYPFPLEPRSDSRGSLFECVKTLHGGQVFYSSTHPGITRGNHFHFEKVERFIVLAGQARISIRRIFSDETQHFDVSGERPCFIDMPTFHAHNIANTGASELLTLFWAHEIFDPAKPDTYAEAV